MYYLVSKDNEKSRLQIDSDGHYYWDVIKLTFQQGQQVRMYR